MAVKFDFSDVDSFFDQGYAEVIRHLAADHGGYDKHSSYDRGNDLFACDLHSTLSPVG